MPRQTLPSASRPVAWALLSQVFWLPLLVIDLHDRWQASVAAHLPRPGEAGFKPLLSPKPPGAGLAPPTLEGSLTGRLAGNTSGILLGARPGAGQRGAGPLIATAQAAAPAPGLAVTPMPSPSEAVLPGGYSRAELLGGPIGLADLQAGVIPPLALAEQGRRAMSGDPMAALPEGWREPMRQALQNLPTPGGEKARIETARLIHIPSSRISAATEVPLALQADGSVDILSRPREAVVVEEIRTWSSRQPLPAAGTVTPAVVHLHPLEEAQPLRPAAISAHEPVPEPAPEPATVPAASPEPTP